MPEEMPWADPVVVPDDIRALQSDIDAYHREMRLARRRDRRRWLTQSRLWQRLGFPLGVVTGALALAAIVSAVLVVDTTGHPRRPAAEPLARSTVHSGAVGGLLPAARVTTTDGARVSAVTFRPALLVLLPPHCSCPTLLDSLASQAADVDLQLIVIGPQAPDAEVAALPGQLHHGRVVAAYDDASALSRAYAADGVTALVVAGNGVVTYLQRDVTAATRLELPLQAALLDGVGGRS